MTSKSPRIIFFIKGLVPTALEKKEALQYGANTTFRTIQFVEDGGLERADGVAGSVPAPYQKYPKAEEAFAAYKATIDAELAAELAALDKEAAAQAPIEQPVQQQFVAPQQFVQPQQQFDQYNQNPNVGWPQQ